MLPDDVIVEAAEKLAAYRKDGALTEILDQYSTLIDDYKRLKSDYEEERDGRERYKQLARVNERDSFALVLVDGDRYIFNKSCISSGEEGGRRAAKQLTNAIKALLQRKGVDKCDIIIQVHANLATLASRLAKKGFIGAEECSFGGFVAGFNQYYGLTNFIDSGKDKDGTRFKVKSALRFYSRNAQCKHIYFAGCHDAEYTFSSTLFRGDTGRYTLLSTPDMVVNEYFQKLNLRVEELPDVFLVDTPAKPPASSGQVNLDEIILTLNGSSKRPASPPQPSQGASSGDAHFTPFYPPGKSRVGRSSEHSSRSDRPSAHNFLSPQLTTSPSPRPRGDASHATAARQSTKKYDLKSLPTEVARGFVAVNVDAHRLDAYMHHPRPEEITRLREYQTMRKKLCNTHQLTGLCFNIYCPYDHDPMPAQYKPALEWLSRTLPCDLGGACRRKGCVWGHICQKADCKHQGGMHNCRFPISAGSEDYQASSYVRALPQATPPTAVHRDAAPKVEFGNLNYDG
ncbi:hypothetical protein HJFPF1_08010 [Paramyrothecium foliicola]|nr:hypothetical protein HJFPF1_08010 [Paramyrothecium foliicola]